MKKEKVDHIRKTIKKQFDFIEKQNYSKKEKDDLILKLMLALSSIIGISSLAFLFKSVLESDKNKNFINNFHKAVKVSGKGKEIYEKIHGEQKNEIIKIKFPPNFGKEHLKLGIGYSQKQNNTNNKKDYPDEKQIEKLKSLGITPKIFKLFN